MVYVQALEAMSGDEQVCTRIVQTQLHADLLSNLRLDALSPEVLDDSNSVEQRRFVDRQLSTLYNVARNSATTTGRCAFTGCLDIVHKFCQVTAYPVSSLLRVTV